MAALGVVSLVSGVVRKLKKISNLKFHKRNLSR